MQEPPLTSADHGPDGLPRTLPPKAALGFSYASYPATSTRYPVSATQVKVVIPRLAEAVAARHPATRVATSRYTDLPRVGAAPVDSA